MNIEVEELLKLMKQFFENVDKEQQDLREELSEKQLEQEDLLHEIELSDLNAAESAKVMKKLKQVRKERRVIKNDLERIGLIQHFTEKYNNKFICNEIAMLLKELRKQKENQDNRKYSPRVLTNLKVGGGSNDNKIATDV